MEIITFVKIFLMAMTPIGELRLAIPVGLSLYQLDIFTVYLISVLGNITAVFIILTMLGFVSEKLSKHFYFFNRFFDFLFSKTRKNHSLKVKKYGVYALIAFVAIPLPVTGGWTASLIAFVFDIPFKKAFPAIAVGILIAGVIVSFISNAGIMLHEYFGWGTLIGIILMLVVVNFIYSKIKNNNHKKNAI
jgi:uncharacterized membrane protein